MMTVEGADGGSTACESGVIRRERGMAMQSPRMTPFVLCIAIALRMALVPLEVDGRKHQAHEGDQPDECDDEREDWGKVVRGSVAPIGSREIRADVRHAAREGGEERRQHAKTDHGGDDHDHNTKRDGAHGADARNAGIGMAELVAPRSFHAAVDVGVPLGQIQGQVQAERCEDGAEGLHALTKHDSRDHKPTQIERLAGAKV